MKRTMPSLRPLLVRSTLCTTLLFSLGCNMSSRNNAAEEFNRFGFQEGIYSTRPQTAEPVITILKLKSSALLETAKKENGSLVLDKASFDQLQKEQEATIKALQKISSEIRILIRYKFVLNALTIYAPADVLEQIKAIPNVVMIEKSTAFARPELPLSKEDDEDPAGIVGPKTSVKFIGSEAAYALGIHGEGMKVGIIDTGIDYTHKMFLGEGTKEAYKNNKPDQPNPAFPTKKVVAGIDLVGTTYNAASPVFENRLPKPDLNPLDEGGHGTHVAGTVAGLGDGVNTYDGVAPSADLYAIKVFGAKGSTSDEIVIAGLEYAINPSGVISSDLKVTGSLDVLNLSLGSDYGSPHIMYNEAIKNTVRGGVVVVISAGNSGDKSFVVGAPGISEDAISVASSLDSMNQTIQFPTLQVDVAGELTNVEFKEGAVSKLLEQVESAKAEAVYAGLANEDFSSELKERLKGRIALIDRGVVSFVDKIRRAQEAGAIGVVVVTNDDAEPIVMGGADGNTDKFDIPAVMIKKDIGTLIKAKLAQGVAVVIDLKSKAMIEKPELIDTISAFSSRGPRSEDGLIKPEITSPGSNIISAKMGGGEVGVQMSGTSMAAPHIAGVMALLKQKFSDLNSYELKSVLLGHGKLIGDVKKTTYSVSRQGAGRVQVAESLTAQVVSVPSTLSLGITDIEKQKTLLREITIKNISKEQVTLTPQWQGSSAIDLQTEALTLGAGESKKVSVLVKLNATKLKAANEELDGFLVYSTEKGVALKLPALAILRRISQIEASPVKVQSTSAADSAGSVATLEIKNSGVNKGSALLFNLLGKDSRKKDLRPDAAHNRNCDLQSAGYRIIEKDGERILQFALKLYEGMTTWNRCEVNIQLDSNGDSLPDQEIAGTTMDSLAGLTDERFASLLLDGNKARELRKQFEADLAADPKKAKEDYKSAVVDLRAMKVFDQSTLAIVEANISNLALADAGQLKVKISTTHQDSGAIEYDDYLGKQESEWEEISVNEMAQAFTRLPEEIELAAQSSTTINLIKGYDLRDLVIYAPQNRGVRDNVLEDMQSRIVPVQYAP